MAEGHDEPVPLLFNLTDLFQLRLRDTHLGTKYIRRSLPIETKRVGMCHPSTLGKASNTVGEDVDAPRRVVNSANSEGQTNTNSSRTGIIISCRTIYEWAMVNHHQGGDGSKRLR